jgi:hypothetical protein
MSRSILGAVFLLFLGAGSTERPLNTRSLEGAWKIVEVQTIQANGQVRSVIPLESSVIFAWGHYSFCWTSHRSPTQTWQVADSERVVRYNQSLINAGTYTISDSLLVTRADFALVPKFVGGSATFRYVLSADTLTLTGLSVLSSDGILHPTYASGAHGVNKLVRVK